MKLILMILISNLASIAAIVGATQMALNKIEGWGWMVFAALLLSCTYERTTK